MAYTIDRYNNTQLTIVEDGTIDQTTDLKLVGKNYAGYGEIQNENFVFLLENFSGANPPPKALNGQIWYDSSVKKLKFYDATRWRTTGGAEVSATVPAGLTEGDFWWDTANEQLYAYNGTDFILVGPQDAGEGITQWLSRTVRDDSAATRSVIIGFAGDVPVAILSSQEFTIDATDSENAIAGFDRVRQGITLRDTQNAFSGVTQTAYRFWGTASNADRLGGSLASEYIKTTSANFTTLATFSDTGLAVGDSNDLRIKIENDNQAVIANEVGTLIMLRTKDGLGNIKTPLRILANSIIPGLQGDGVSTETVTIGSTSQKFNNVYADNFTGLAEKTTALVVASTNRVGSESATSSTVAVRTSTTETIAGQSIPAGSLKANYFVGISTQAQYADLAEKYTTAEELPVGTAVAVSNNADYEVEPAGMSQFAIGVVSAEPAYLMNAESDGQAIGLKGRVPVRVMGEVKKGQAVYAWENGVCSALETRAFVGIALETNSDAAEKLVECVLKV
jgi:hypothetical protein